ncbi:MAG TPA: thioredoxin domain-containing protein [Pyrinomonadaceae bacterium]|jgi:protein-disulfide isomerase
MISLQRFSRFAVLVILFLSASAILAQSDEGLVLAVVDGRKITQAEVDLSVMAKMLPLKQQIYSLRKSALENLIVRSLLESEAKRRGISVEVLKKELTSGIVSVSPNQVEEVYRENEGAFGVMSPDEAKERIRLDLESQARMQNYRSALANLKKEAKVRVLLVEPRVNLSRDTSSPSVGPKDAAVTITEFSDFECPYCREARGTIKKVLAAYPERVRIVFKHLPLDIHTQAFAAARAAYCGGQENRFWQFHDALFMAKELSTDSLNKIATNVGVNQERFKVCMISDRSRVAVLKDLQEAKRLGIDSTPTFIINGRIVRGAVSFESFKQIIDHELELISNSSQSRVNDPAAQRGR